MGPLLEMGVFQAPSAHVQYLLKTSSDLFPLLHDLGGQKRDICHFMMKKGGLTGKFFFLVVVQVGGYNGTKNDNF